MHLDVARRVYADRGAPAVAAGCAAVRGSASRRRTPIASAPSTPAAKREQRRQVSSVMAWFDEESEAERPEWDEHFYMAATLKQKEFEHKELRATCNLRERQELRAFRRNIRAMAAGGCFDPPTIEAGPSRRSAGSGRTDGSERMRSRRSSEGVSRRMLAGSVSLASRCGTPGECAVSPLVPGQFVDSPAVASAWAAAVASTPTPSRPESSMSGAVRSWSFAGAVAAPSPRSGSRGRPPVAGKAATQDFREAMLRAELMVRTRALEDSSQERCFGEPPELREVLERSAAMHRRTMELIGRAAQVAAAAPPRAATSSDFAWGSEAAMGPLRSAESVATAPLDAAGGGGEAASSARAPATAREPRPAPASAEGAGGGRAAAEGAARATTPGGGRAAPLASLPFAKRGTEAAAAEDGATQVVVVPPTVFGSETSSVGCSSPSRRTAPPLSLLLLQAAEDRERSMSPRSTSLQGSLDLAEAPKSPRRHMLSKAGGRSPMAMSPVSSVVSLGGRSGSKVGCSTIFQVCRSFVVQTDAGAEELAASVAVLRSPAVGDVADASSGDGDDGGSDESRGGLIVVARLQKKTASVELVVQPHRVRGLLDFCAASAISPPGSPSFGDGGSSASGAGSPTDLAPRGITRTLSKETKAEYMALCTALQMRVSENGDYELSIAGWHEAEVERKKTDPETEFQELLRSSFNGSRRPRDDA